MSQSIMLFCALLVSAITILGVVADVVSYRAGEDDNFKNAFAILFFVEVSCLLWSIFFYSFNF